eukprot:TRINITY_DN62616_c0_g1_i1.p1 TRINITY_DN62616_c0_g1~~TRINITY_DN62616_c0_g1_i1.p1  ORF type:complete len:281 (-),score=50.73 TRINITY_DN62616_c0_g1_i1:49-858(-)
MASRVLACSCFMGRPGSAVAATFLALISFTRRAVVLAEVPAAAPGFAHGGCCYSFGYGALMRPVELEAHVVESRSLCNVEVREGGATCFIAGECPENAEAAKTLAAAQPESCRAPQMLSEEKGPCCFSYTYDEKKRPCCLQTHPVQSLDECSGLKRDGGSTGGSATGCPATAEDAARSLGDDMAVPKDKATGDDIQDITPEVICAAGAILLLVAGLAMCCCCCGRSDEPTDRQVQPKQTKLLAAKARSSDRSRAATSSSRAAHYHEFDF